MGQDIADYGGVFKITDGFVEEFGKGRVRNTPLCESAILGAGFGLSINKHKAMVEMQFADFVTEGMTQIINNCDALITTQHKLMFIAFNTKQNKIITCVISR